MALQNRLSELVSLLRAEFVDYDTLGAAVTDHLTAKGDVLTHDGTETIGLGVGTDGQVLTADSSQPEGLSWTDGGGTSGDHGGLSGLGDDDHAQYVHISNARTITAQHDFAPTVTQAPFTLGANAQSQLVTGLRADEVSKSVIAGDGLSGGGTLTANVTVDLAEPGTLTATTANDPTGAHTHKVGANSDPGATADLLATDANGLLQLRSLVVGDRGLPTTFAGLKTLEVREVTSDTTATNYGEAVEFIVSLGSPSSQHYYASYSNVRYNAATVSITGRMVGVQGQVSAEVNSPGNISQTRGVAGISSLDGTGTIAVAYGGYFGVTNTSTGTITDARGVAVIDGSNSGTIANKTGVAINRQTGATNNTDLLVGTLTIPTGDYGLYVAGSRPSLFEHFVGLNTDPVYWLDVRSNDSGDEVAFFLGKVTIRSDGDAIDQLSLIENVSANSATFTVDSSGELFIDPSGLTVEIDGGLVLRNNFYLGWTDTGDTRQQAIKWDGGDNLVIGSPTGQHSTIIFEGPTLGAPGMVLNPTELISHVTVETDNYVTGTSGWTLNYGTGGAEFTGAVEIFDDFTVGANILFVDYSGTRVGINRAPDAQFDLDINGNMRAGGYIVGKHALQIEGATMIVHWDGIQDKSDITGVFQGHKGQNPTILNGEPWFNYPGRFGKSVVLGPTQSNLITNPSAETNLTNWSSASLGTLTRTSADSRWGAWSVLAESGGGQTITQAVALSATQAGGVGTAQHTATAYVRNDDVPTGGDIQIFIRGTGGANADSTFSSATVAAVADADGWIRIEHTFTPDFSDRTGLQLRVRFTGITADGQGFYIDGAMITATAWAVPYFDESFPDITTTSTEISHDHLQIIYDTPELDDPYDPGTIAFWFRTDGYDTSGGNQYLLFYSDGGTGFTFVALNGTGIRARVGNNAATVASSPGVNDGEWHHVALTWAGGPSTDFYIYVDGVEYGPNSQTGYTGTPEFRMGDDAGASFYGDDLLVADRQLDAEEILAIFESNAPVFAETSTFSWNDPSTTIWVDEEGLYARAADGVAIMALSTVDGKTWGGQTLDAGDFLLGSGNSILLWDKSNPSLLLGDPSNERIGIDTGGIEIYDDGGNLRVSVSTTATRMFDSSGSKWLEISGGLTLYNGSGTAVVDFPTSGDASIVGTLDVTGEITAADVTIDSSGIHIAADTGGTGTPSDPYGVADSDSYYFTGPTGTVGKFYAELDGSNNGGIAIYRTEDSANPVNMVAEFGIEGSQGGAAFLRISGPNAGGGSSLALLAANRFRVTSEVSMDAKSNINVTQPSTGGAIFVDSSDGDLKVKFANGTVKTIATN